MQDRRISFQDLWKGLALDKEYNPNCEKLLDDCLSKYDLTKDDFTGTVADNNCHDKLVRIWLGYEGLPFYFPGKELPVSFDIDGIKPTTFLKEASLPEIEVSKHDLWWFLFFKQDNFPLPAPDVKDKTFWFHGQSNSTEQNKISEEPIWDEKLDSLVYDITMLEGRSYTEDRKKEKRQQVELSIKKQQDDLHKLYCDKKGYPIVGSEEYKVLWKELHRFYKIKVELDEAKRAEYNQWRLERKRLLKREIEAIEGWCRGERKSPTTGEDEVLVDFPSLFAECYPQLKEKEEVKKLRKNQRHKEAVRKAAKKIWDKEDPANCTTIAEMSFKQEIIKACEGSHYKERTIRKWIKDLCPNRKPGRRPGK